MLSHRVKESLEILADFLDCRLSLRDPLLLKRKIFEYLRKNKIETIKILYHVFPNKGATIIFLLADSHLALHTWPEKNLVNIDLFLCNYRRTNNSKIEAMLKDLISYFQPQKKSVKRIKRLT